MICAECGQDKPEASFYVDRSRPRGHVARCKRCYSDKQKVARLGPRKRYSEIKWNATRRGLAFDLTYQQFLDWIWGAPCFYCGEVVVAIGVDRLGNEAHYALDNAVACCGRCNAMKSDLSLHDFLVRVEAIAKNLDLTANAAVALNGMV